MKKVAYFLSGVILTLVLFGGALFYMNQSRSSNEAIDPEVITESQHLDFTLEPIAELALEEYNYSGVVVHTNENHRLFNRLSIPLTGNRFLFYYQGTAKAGVRDASQINVERIDNERKFVIDIPKVEVLSSQIDTSSIELYDQSNNPIRQHDIQDVMSVLAGEEEKSSKKAVAAGLLEEAQTQLDDLLTVQVKSIVENSEWDDYTVEIQHAGETVTD